MQVINAIQGTLGITKEMNSVFKPFITFSRRPTFKQFFGSQIRLFSKPAIFIKQKSRRKWGLALVGGMLLGSGVYYQTLDSVNKRQVRITLSGINRFLRSLRIGLTISVDYWWSLRGLHIDSPEYSLTEKKCHQRSADRLLDGCLQNGGLYVKLGQGLVTLNHILPREYIDTLFQLYDTALARQEKELEELFAEDFGKPPEQVFAEFDRKPFAAASLAQVFKAKTFEGDDVAVKVQYIDLQQRFHGDMNTIYFLLKIVSKIHPDFDFTWVVDYLKECLVKELDFVNEGHNMERCEKELSHLSYLHVPKIHWDKTTKRVLTAEYINGVSVTDIDGIKSLGLKLADVDTKLFNVFSEQIFFTGFVHADPHPGNIFIREGRSGSAEMVLLDHGLYEYLPERSRVALCNLWKSIVLDNQEDMKKYCNELGVTDYLLFCELLMQRPLTRNQFRIPNYMSDSDVAYMKKMAQDHFDDVMHALKELPLPMILVFRNINTVRSIAKVHGHPVDRYVLMGRRAVKGSYSTRTAGFRSFVQSWVQLAKFDFKLRCETIRITMTRYYLRILVWLGWISREGAAEFFHLAT